MLDYMEFDTTPTDEPCTQVQKDGTDYEKMMAEARIYVKQLERMFPPPFSCDFRVKSIAHDFGTYYEVRAYYNSDSEEAMTWVYHVEENLPEHWDEEAKRQLAEWEAKRAA